MIDKVYGVYCERQGVRGYRAAWHKYNNKIVRFGSEEEASAVAKQLSDKVMARQNCYYRYSAKKLPTRDDRLAAVRRHYRHSAKELNKDLERRRLGYRRMDELMERQKAHQPPSDTHIVDRCLALLNGYYQ